MRVAIHYFGHLRTFRDCLPSHKQFLIAGSHQFDVFLHTWDHSDRRTESWYKVNGEIRNVENSDLEFLKKELAPVACSIEPQIFSPGERDLEYISSRKMHESLRKSLRLRLSCKFSPRPDLVIVIRPDILLKRQLDLDYLHTITQDPWLQRAVLTPTHHHPPCGIFQTDRLAGRDSILIGSDEALSHFGSIGLDPSIYSRFPRYNQVGECFFDNFIFQRHLRWVPIEFLAPEDWEIRRSSS
ncbi:hypothetical protein MKK88_16055 [Methylobacterium sp. E-005]|uniref:hypothetical protein n=1 Tax=Methylobacterium sp. E-005 TaxID=2836549 RepID=UPI001FB9B945|nr:hypothetical protein [Methylobacterium sp. E-005]MCJ2087483.1 hypothetical protein [Methylobacterium sp. E-005]